MYCPFYGFTQHPFQLTPDPAFFFRSPSYERALATLLHSLSKRQGLVALLGETGLGKTLLLHVYLARLQQQQCKTIHLAYADLAFRSLLQVLCEGLGLDFTTTPLDAVFTACHQHGSVVLVIDDAHMMPLPTLKKLWTLAGRGTTAEPLFHLVLVGHSTLISMLDALEVQRFTLHPVVPYTLPPLTPEESIAYIYHRLARVTDQVETVFAPQALTQIVQVAQGIPGTLNVLCTNVLLAGFQARQRPVSASMTRTAITNYQGKRQPQYKRRLLLGFAGLGLLIVLVLGMHSLSRGLENAQPQVLSPWKHFISRPFHLRFKAWAPGERAAPTFSTPAEPVTQHAAEPAQQSSASARALPHVQAPKQGSRRSRRANTENHHATQGSR